MDGRLLTLGPVILPSRTSWVRVCVNASRSNTVDLFWISGGLFSVDIAGVVLLDNGGVSDFQLKGPLKLQWLCKCFQGSQEFWNSGFKGVRVSGCMV